MHLVQPLVPPPLLLLSQGLLVQLWLVVLGPVVCWPVLLVQGQFLQWEVGARLVQAACPPQVPRQRGTPERASLLQALWRWAQAWQTGLWACLAPQGGCAST